jgi:Putative prokaryotic signal transducing protein
MSQQSTAHALGWKVVYVAHSEPEASIVAGRLETQGIETFIHRETTGNLAYGVYIDPFGDVSVLVHPHNYDQAAAILDEDVSDVLSDDGDEADETR